MEIIQISGYHIYDKFFFVYRKVPELFLSIIVFVIFTIVLNDHQFSNCILWYWIYSEDSFAPNINRSKITRIMTTMIAYKDGLVIKETK